MKRRTFWLITLFFAVIVSFLAHAMIVSALSITTFNNSLSAENLSLDGTNNITRYLAVPSTTTFLPAGIFNLTYPFGGNITRISSIYNFSQSFNNTFWVNSTSTATGNQAFISKSGDTLVVLAAPSVSTADATLSTNSSIDLFLYGRNITAYFNVSKIGPGSSATWYSKVSLYLGATQYVLNTYSGSAADYLGQYVNIYRANASDTIYTFGGGSSTRVSTAGNAQLEFRSHTEDAGDTALITLYGLNLSQSIAPAGNLTLSIGGSNVLFSPINQTSTNITTIISSASYVNNYLSSCSIVNGYCNVPFVFYSNQPVNIGYSNLVFNNNGFTENNQSYNPSTYETAKESYILNLTYDSTMSISANLYYNNVSYPSTQIGSGNNILFNSTLDVPIGNNTGVIYWQVNIGGNYFNSTIKTQQVKALNISICGAAPLNLPYFNFTFKNETTNQEFVSASISSSFVYYLGDGLVNKTYTYSTSSETGSYAFCVDPSDRSVNIQPNIQYTNSYSQPRSYNPAVNSYSQTGQTTALYLLPTALGTYARFITSVAGGAPISGVAAVISRSLGSSTINIASGITDSSGLYAVFLDPLSSYNFQFSKAGYVTNSFSVAPNFAEPYNVYLTPVGGSGTYIQNGTQIGTGLTIAITPTNGTLLNNTSYVFGLNVTGTGITFISMNITDSNGISLGYISGTNGLITLTANTGNSTYLIGTYVIKTATETISRSNQWIIGNYYTGGYSLFALMTSWDLYNFDYDYYKIIIVLVVLLGAVGGLSAIEVIDTNESKISLGVFIIWGFSYVGWLTMNIAIVNPSSPFYHLNHYANQYGIAIISTIIGLALAWKEVFR